MAFPAPVSITQSQAVTATTSVSITLPTVTSGQGILIVGSARSLATSGPKFSSLPSGWTELYDDGHLSSGFAIYRKADGTESSPLVLTAAATLSQWAADVFLFDAADIEDWDTQPPEHVITPITTATDPWTLGSTLTPTGGAKDYFWLASAHQHTRGLSLVSYPTSYTDNQTRHESSTGGSACVTNYASRNYNGTSQSGLQFDWASSTNATGAIALIVVHPPSGGATTHDTTGAISGPGASITGTATVIRTHATSGALSGPGAVVSGTAARTREHATTAALEGQGAAITGAASRTRVHAATAALAGPGSAITGEAARTRQHAATGTLTGQGSTVSGTAARTRVHATTAALSGQGADVSGSAERTGGATEHATSGALVGPGSDVSGSASRTRVHVTTAALTGAGSAVSGVSVHLRIHVATGALQGPGASVTGAAQRNAAHSTSGVLVGPGSTVDGSALIGADTTSALRLYSILGEDRNLTIAGEDRIYSILGEDRTMTILGEDRGYTV